MWIDGQDMSTAKYLDKACAKGNKTLEPIREAFLQLSPADQERIDYQVQLLVNNPKLRGMGPQSAIELVYALGRFLATNPAGRR